MSFTTFHSGIKYPSGEDSGEQSVDGRPPAAGRSKAAAPLGSAHRWASWCLAASTFAALVLAAWTWSTFLDGRWTILSGTASLATFLVLFGGGHFRINMFEGGRVKLRASAGAAAVGVTAAMLVISLPGLGQPGVRSFSGLMAALTIAAVGARLLARWGLERAWVRGHLRATALIYGADRLATEMALEITLRPERGVDIGGFLSSDPSETARQAGMLYPVYPVRPETLQADLAAAVATAGAARLIVGPPSGGDDELAQRSARWAASQGLPVHVVPRFHEMGLGLDSMSPDLARGFPLVRLQRSAHPTLSRKIKRLLDITLSATALVALSPVLLLAAVLVRLSSRGPVLFEQERVGQGGRPIVVRKFRSMRPSRFSDTEWNPESRVTRVGSWLRRTNVDELPQLLSILKGDMSLVGPRPERPAFVERFRKTTPDYDDRHRVPVGLTGLAQVAGLRGDTSITERVKYDNLYIDQWSLRSDLEILAQTASAILFQTRRATNVVELDALLARPASDGVDEVPTDED